jgi:hypothetical protein
VVVLNATMTKTIGVHELAYETFHRMLQNMQERQHAEAFPVWKVSAGRLLEFLVWYFEESQRLQCATCMPMVINFSPAVGGAGRYDPASMDRRQWPYKYSVACKMIRAEKGVGYMATHAEVLAYIRANPDIGMNTQKRKDEEEATKREIAQRSRLQPPTPPATSGNHE